jgi:hypothetical protein
VPGTGTVPVIQHKSLLMNIEKKLVSRRRKSHQDNVQ